MTQKKFTQTIWNYYKTHGRHDLSWRQTRNPYHILVSEIMLQQTQVSRVIPKYQSFLKKFPTTKKLAESPLRSVLAEWQGLGYNRRALYLRQSAEKIEKEYNGVFPKDMKTLCSLPGVGLATAGDILAFAYNIAVPLIETNIRTVYIHFFFPHKEKVSDVEILPLIEKTLDRKNPREWYWALFDYGAHLKETKPAHRKSTYYKKQSAFKGSNREQRAKILALIIEKPRTIGELVTAYGIGAQKNVETMIREGLIKKKGRFFMIQ